MVGFKHLVAGSVLLAGLAAPAASAHTGAMADHSHMSINVFAWIAHIVTGYGHEAAAAAFGLALAGGVAVFLMRRAQKAR